MEDNRIQETKEVLEQTANLIKNVQSGNYIAAAKQAIKLLKSKQAKKMLRKKIIKALLKILPPILSVVIFLAIVMSMTDKMISLLSNISTTVGGMWQWMTDDYWIKLDEEIEYVVDTETGETLGTTQEVDVTDGREIEKYTLVDKYIKELGNMGISIRDLRLLGEADYSDIDALLEDKDNKKLVEKYISEFVRADLITQEFHKRRGNELVSPNNEDYIDGGIYLYRSKKEQTITEDQFNNGSYKEDNIEVDDKDYKQMTYVDKDKFDEMIANNDKDARYSFSIDRDTGELLVAQITTTTVVEADVSNTINNWFADLYDWLSNYNLAGTTTYELETVRIPYKDLISKYTMPYEFLINLCEITQNPEFVYHVALLARDTNIVLAIQDNTTITRETVETEEYKEEYKNYSDSSTSGATLTDEKTEKRRKVTTVTTQTPVLRIEYADTWSFYEEFEYTKNTEGTIEEKGPITQNIPLPSTLPGHQEAETKTEISYEGVPIEVITDEYWYGTFTVKRITKTQNIVASTTYNETGDPTENSVEKSKQFLGLLRNNTGKCPYDCFYHWNQAKYCAEDSEFDRGGINVRYKIPNMTREESPLNKLTSGLEILYSSMQTSGNSNSGDVQNYDPDTDYGSIYNQKMQGLVEHMRYLMTFPENESYTVKDLILDIFPGDGDEEDDEDDDIVVDEGVIASAKEIYEFLIGKGFTPESACAILGNIQQESSFNTAATNGTHYGLCQWGGGRWIKLRLFAAQRGTSWTDLDTQLEYLWSELCGTKLNVKNAIINSTDMEDATDIFCRKFEICGNYGVEVPKRYKYAKYWYNILVSGEDTNLTTNQNALLYIINNLSNYSGIANDDGYCQSFVRTVFEKMGITGSAGSASTAEKQWKVSTNINNIPVGATVYGKGSGTDGHVGIYIGNGMVVHNIGKSNNCSYSGLKGIKCESISSWNKKYRFTSWGWQGGVDLTI